MAPSKVYFTNMRTSFNQTLPMKFEKLIRAAGITTMNLDNQYVAVKLHFGEPGNLAYLRPQYAATLVSVLKEMGAKPFLTDCNTLYVGGRKNALDHLDTAWKNGFTPYAMGCQVIIADGLKGTDDVEVPVEGCDYVKAAKIGRAVMDADAVISLNHFKGHENAGLGGALKNIGMGCGSRAGKMEMHNSGKPFVHTESCIGCGRCAMICAHDAAKVTDRKASIDQDKCVGCGRCIGVCPMDAVETNFDEANDVLNYKIAEYSKAVLQGRPHFHISLVVDVSPYCDCHSENDVPIVPDVGMFASFDPVALDCACGDAVNAQQANPGSLLSEIASDMEDHFTAIAPTTNWRAAVEHAEKIGIGQMAYELVTVK